MKRALLAGVGLLALAMTVQPAAAADPPRAPVVTKAPPLAAPMFNWTGFYVGANAGYAWGRATATNSPASNGACWAICGTEWGPKVEGFTGGLQAGWNVQMQNWVFGIEGDVGYLNFKGRAADPENDDALFVQTRGGWFGMMRGRAGVLFSPTVLVYGTAGVIYADTRTNVWRTVSNFNTTNADSLGWTAGGGVEASLGHAWSWKLEYLYYDLGSDRVEGPIGASTQYFPVEQTGHIVRVGLNYRFATGKAPIGKMPAASPAVVTKY